MTIAIGNRRRPVLRYKAAWTDDWIEAPRGSYMLDTVTEGSSSAFGSCDIDVPRLRAVNRESEAPTEPDIAVDSFVQIGAEDPEIATADRIRWLWIGVVTSFSYDHQGYEETGTEESLVVLQTYHCEGLASILQRVTYQRSVARCHDGSAANVPEAHAFNVGGIGDRWSPALADGTYAHRWDRDAAATARWTARQVIQRILKDHLNGVTLPSLPAFQITGQLELLDYTDTWTDFGGMRLAEILTALCGGRRGGTWRVEPTSTGNGTVDIRITSGLDAAVTITGVGDIASVTLPASDRQVAELDTADSHWTVTSDIQERPRKFILKGMTKSTMTLAFRAGTTTSYDGLIRGWASADDAQAGAADRKYADVFHRFYLDPAWSGKVNATYGLASALQRTGGEYDGVRLVTGVAFPTLACVLDPDLVIADMAHSAAGAPVSLATWAGDATAVIPAIMPRDFLRIYVHNGTTVSEVSDQFQVGLFNDPRPGIEVGVTPDDAKRLAAMLGTHADRRILVTLTIQEPLPLLISSEPANATTDVQVCARAELHQVLPETAVGFTAGGTLTYLGASTIKTIRDDRPILKQILKGLGPYLNRIGGAKITNGLDLFDADTHRPGTLILTYSDGRATPIDLSGIVTRRTWNFTEDGYGTTLELEPLTLDLRAFL